ncbi:MAG: hypothetical protein ACTHMS_11905 [Jatrophihabitans sp.]|uniref:hypothetical protein n=1 Tax=Jatrophihabitans sp. TaxID=1932789 RepID=UPI003F807AD2
MATTSDEVAASFQSLTAADQKAVAQRLRDSQPGLFDLDPVTRRIIWGAVFVVLLAIAVGALAVIWHSYTVDITTTTGTGANRTTTTSHPDVSAAWAVISAVVAGIVGLLVPSPTSGKA